MPKTYRRRTHSKRRHRNGRAHRRGSTQRTRTRTRRHLGRQMGGCNCGMPSIPFFRGGGEGEPTYLTPEKPAHKLPPHETLMRPPRVTMEGGSHRENCQCSSCKRSQMGGGGMTVASSVDGTVSSPMPYPINSYQNDVSRPIMEPTPYLGALPVKGGRRRKRTQRGGNLTNFLTQDLVNVGRQIQFGMGSAYNALSGYSAPVNPLPWKDQFPSHTTFLPTVHGVTPNHLQPSQITKI